MATFYPLSTYRLQFHKQFTFQDAEKIVPYLAALGVDAVYASPIFKATPGSMHGYDVINPQEINPEIGSMPEFKALVQLLKQHNIGWVQDIVPNHMAFHMKNIWLMDVLEKGKQSAYASYFDTAMGSDYFEGPLMVPFLGVPLEEAIAKGELQLALEGNALVLSYYDNYYPVNFHTYQLVLTEGAAKMPAGITQIQSVLAHLNENDEGSVFQEHLLAFEEAFIEALKKANFKKWLKQRLKEANTPVQLKKIVAAQYYEPCFWQETDKRINYRRFFTVNSLICLNVHLPEVFEAVHRLPKTLLDEGLIQGLRIDHIDGLSDPTAYVNQLRSFVGEEVYIVVEKILAHDEVLPKYWPIAGTSGYDYLGCTNKLFTEAGAEKKITNYYTSLIADEKQATEQVPEKKMLILKEHMQGELDNIFRYLKRLKLLPSKIGKTYQEHVRLAIAQFWTAFPVYRFYGNALPLDATEQELLRSLFIRLTNEHPLLQDAFQFLAELFIGNQSRKSTSYKRKVALFYQRLMQFSGPLMAKGVEDTLMYTYNRFIAHNEVGDHPTFFSMPVDAYHQWMQKRLLKWPFAMNGTSTHDTKRGEDVRARLQVIASLYRQWLEVFEQIKKEHPILDIDWNDAYFVVQTLIGTYPVEKAELPTFKEERLKTYLQKALREAKVHSGWTDPNETYEHAAHTFAVSLMEGSSWTLLLPFIQEIQDCGMINSLAQLVLKLTAVGVPDIYQGTELWDLSLVDPDNRRSVDYEKRIHFLESYRRGVSLDTLWKDRESGRIKLYLLQLLLRYRRERPFLFADGFYLPLKVSGRYRDHVLAFARRYKQHWSITVIPLHIAHIWNGDLTAIETFHWKDTAISWPEGAPVTYRNVLDGKEGTANKKVLLKDIFDTFPLAVLEANEEPSERSVGVLLPVFSLPGPFGLGDFGNYAQKFIQYLADAKQRYWQLLPLNPSGKNEFYSPYSAISAMAGSPLYISMEKLVANGYLKKEDLLQMVVEATDEVNYAMAEKAKHSLLKKAYHQFSLLPEQDHRVMDFDNFCKQEETWLEDFAIYAVLKAKHKQQPWYKWPERFKERHPAAIEKFKANEREAIRNVQWQQYIFFQQWQQLKRYGNRLGIQFFGDIPFYVNYDSADVWSHRELFLLDKNGKMRGVAGVPPDYFNAEGQLWGMPVFNWNKMKATGYQWWIERVKKNMELYDLVRLDHFRAFYDYWEVPGNAKTAEAGRWKKGPGIAFFQVLENALGALPFVAEDLGDISDGVYTLRDDLHMPGMKVLQFAFGKNLPHSPHAPHNYSPKFVGYTGTHDNNTVVGWYQEDIDQRTRKQLTSYSGQQVTEKNVHEVMARLAYASVADIAILPMQDVLGLSGETRTNKPATTGSNWKWRLKKKQLDKATFRWISDMALLYGR
ncbi:malto-oligosyltrehalose synthase [Olivibacter sp. SDN3]|uniref:malto-oligosyltrehalose synthase n=1 Tax=Olivibacter sp. SDN3 TaxID=2764720 RepID=UPI001651596A|nr:malto-oligosyltrehalose synthase [Olivibacter sp. SDN3]QNL50348.1 malto-oligosyltrehalose synthase [Olivibacter sp. SDN3]